MRLAILFFLPAAAIAWAQSLQPPSPSGAIVSGRVQDASGNRIGAAWVTIIRDPADPKAPPPRFQASTAAWPDGTFAFTGLDAGIYHFCARLAGSTWLNPCDWDTKQTSVTLKTGEIRRDVAVSMKAGTKLRLRLDDPGQLLNQYEKKTPGAHVLVGVVTTTGTLLPAAITGDDGKGQDHEMLVPADTALKVVVTSGFFKLADSKGNAIAPGAAPIGITLPSGQTQTPGPAAAQVKVTVTGLVKP
jgi:hypothetical protein